MATQLIQRSLLRAAPHCVAFALLFGVHLPAAAQVKPSQTGSVSQHVAETIISMGYDRPVARGRVLFGDEGIVDYDALWTPGANRTTWIDFSTSVTLEGEEVAAGRYGLWTIPQGSGGWEVILVSDWDTHHSFFPVEAEVLRVSVEPTSANHVETLAFYFPEVEGYEATLAMHWGTLVLPLRIVAPE